MPETNFKAKLLSELKAAPKDAWALVGGFATAVGLLSITRHKFEVNLFDLILNAYNGIIADFWKNLLSHAGIKLSIFASSALSWFVILYGLHLRGIKKGYYRIDISLLKNSFNNFCWFGLASFGPAFIARYGTPPTTLMFATMIAAGIGNIGVVLFLYLRFRNKMNWFYPFENASSSLINASLSVIIFFVIVILNSLIFQILNSNAIPDLDGWLEAAAIATFVPVFSIFLTAGFYVFIFNIYLAVSVPRALFGALIVLAVILGADPLLKALQVSGNHY